MTGPQHYTEGERLIEIATRAYMDLAAAGRGAFRRSAQERG